MTLLPRNKRNINRRQFIGITWGLSFLGLIGQAGLALLEFFTPRVEPNGFGSKIVAGSIDEFPPGSVNFVRKGHCYIVRDENGGVLALWSRCTHLGCTVPFKEAEGIFHCPCHSSLFSRQGDVLGGPAPRPLDRFEISLAEDNLVIDTGQPIQRQQFDEGQYFFPE